MLSQTHYITMVHPVAADAARADPDFMPCSPAHPAVYPNQIGWAAGSPVIVGLTDEHPAVYPGQIGWAFGAAVIVGRAPEFKAASLVVTERTANKLGLVPK